MRFGDEGRARRGDARRRARRGASPCSARAARARRTLLRVDRRPAAAGRRVASCSTARTSRRSPPHRRGIGLVFQDHALFPHRDVAGNVAFGLRMRGDAPRGRSTRASRTSSSSSSGSPGSSSVRWRRSRAASSSGSRSRGRSHPSRASSCSTSRSDRSIGGCAIACSYDLGALFAEFAVDCALRHARPGRGVRARRPRRRHARGPGRADRDAGRALGSPGGRGHRSLPRSRQRSRRHGDPAGSDQRSPSRAG